MGAHAMSAPGSVEWGRGFQGPHRSRNAYLRHGYNHYEQATHRACQHCGRLTVQFNRQPRATCSRCTTYHRRQAKATTTPVAQESLSLGQPSLKLPPENGCVVAAKVDLRRMDWESLPDLYADRPDEPVLRGTVSTQGEGP